MNLKLIKGNKQDKTKPTINKSELYSKAFTRTLERGAIDADNIKRIVFYGVRYINNMTYPGEYLQEDLVKKKLGIIFSINNVMSLLTPAQLLNIYPVEKTYQGEKNQWKDYFYTMNVLKDYDMDRPIGNRLDDLLWDYMNNELFRYQATLLKTSSEFRRLQGQPTIMEEWAEKEGLETYTLNEDAKGVKYMQSSSGKTFPIKQHKRKPVYLKVVKSAMS